MDLFKAGSRFTTVLMATYFSDALYSDMLVKDFFYALSVCLSTARPAQ